MQGCGRGLAGRMSIVIAALARQPRVDELGSSMRRQSGILLDAHPVPWTRTSRAGHGPAPKAVAIALGATVKTVNEGIERFQARGRRRLIDRSSRPRGLRQSTPDMTVERIAALRRQRWTGDRIARQVSVAPATVGRVRRRLDSTDRAGVRQEGAAAQRRGAHRGDALARHRPASRRFQPHRRGTRPHPPRLCSGQSGNAPSG